MSLGNLCRRNVVTVEPGTTVSEVTRIMEDNNIGCVIVNGVHVARALDRRSTLGCKFARARLAA